METEISPAGAAGSRRERGGRSRASDGLEGAEWGFWWAGGGGVGPLLGWRGRGEASGRAMALLMNLCVIISSLPLVRVTGMSYSAAEMCSVQVV